MGHLHAHQTTAVYMHELGAPKPLGLQDATGTQTRILVIRKRSEPIRLLEPAQAWSLTVG